MIDPPHLIRISWLISLRLSTGRAELGEGAAGGYKKLDICIVACLIKLMCMLTNSLTASNYAIGTKGRYLYLWVLGGCGYLWVAGNLYEMRGECG